MVNANACVKYTTIEGRYVPVFDFEMLGKTTRLLVQSLEQTIDRSYYPESTPEVRAFSVKHRPICVGVQGLADTLALLQLPWETEGARALNYQIYECIYYNATHESMLLSQKRKTYGSFPNSPIAKGLMAPDMWMQEELIRRCDQPTVDGAVNLLPTMMDIRTRYARYARYSPDAWEMLRNDIKAHGLRHSLRTGNPAMGVMAQVTGCIEGREPSVSCPRSTLFGLGVAVVNPHMVADLKILGLWNSEVATQIHREGGSLSTLGPLGVSSERALSATVRPQEISSPPRLHSSVELIWLKQVYKTAFEIPQALLLQYSIDVNRFMDHAEARQLYLRKPTINVLTTYLFQAWLGGIKTGLWRLCTE
jgi:ribonucleoside-diphosphate reductase alpha chain